MSESAFDSLRSTLEKEGVAATFGRLIDTLREEKKLPQLFEALLMKKRHELGLPLEGTESIRDIPQEHQEAVENYYVEVCRIVGGLFLDQDDIVSAWPYFRAIDEPDKVKKAIESWSPPEGWDEYDENAETDETDGYDQLDAVIDIAFHQGAHPVRGYELILSHHGTCRAITTIEHQLPQPGDVKESCAKLLIEQLYGELRDSLRADIERGRIEGGGVAVPEDAPVSKLIEDRSWLFDNLGYHVDISHLQSCVRVASNITDREIIEKAIEMCDYGRNLARDFQIQERPPFDDFYNDYRIFLRAMVNEGVDGAVRYFTSKADSHGPDEDGNHFCAEVLVQLLHRVGRTQEAIDTFLKYLKDVPGPTTASPSLLTLCEAAGDYSRLLSLSAEKEDLLQYTLALAKGATTSS